MPATRRSFLAILMGAAAAAARPFTAGAQTSPTPAPPLTPTPAPPDPKAEALVQLARERYGRFLSPEEIPMLEDRVRALERRGARLRAVRLSNGEEPAASFKAGRA
jgi:hypothetical protein